MNAEQEDNFRLRKADEFLAHCKEVENQARAALARAEVGTKAARARYETFFTECEARAVARRKSGLIVNSSCYGD